MILETWMIVIVGLVGFVFIKWSEWHERQRWLKAYRTGESLYHDGALYLVRPPIPCKCNVCGTGHKAADRDRITRELSENIDKQIREWNK